MESKWEEGLWFGHTRNSNEVLVGNKDGIVKAYAIRRRPLEERWDDAMVRSLKATPSGWSTEEAMDAEHPIVTEEDDEPPSEEEEEDTYSQEIRLRKKLISKDMDSPTNVQAVSGYAGEQNRHIGTMICAENACMIPYSVRTRTGGGDT